MMYLAILLGLLPAFIAKKKGESFFVWWFYGMLLFIFAFPHSLFLKSNSKKCPYCCSDIPRAAIICKYCRKTQPKDTTKGGKK